MKLYHYSKDKYSVLKTRRTQGILTKEEIQQADLDNKGNLGRAAYIDHISFFFDPIPLLLLPKLYKNENTSWFKGSHLVEYTVESDTLEKHIAYYVTETPEDLKDIEKIDDKKWDSDPSYSKHYFEQKVKRKKTSGEIGTSLVELNKQISLYKGRTEEFYLLASKRKDFKENIKKYAASVPHVMVYPSKGLIPYVSTRNVVMGFMDVAKEVSLKPGFQNW